MEQLIMKTGVIVLGIALLCFYAAALSGVYQDFADYCERIAEDREKEYEIEVDIDPETGQRTSTIIKD